MRQRFLTSGTIHFIGIGGIGMSGIAEVLHRLDYRVSGSDITTNAYIRRLKEMGIHIFQGHEEGNIQGAAVVVASSAIGPDNVELKAAMDQGIPIVHRAEMLAELMRYKSSIAVAGTHGKTTTTSLCATILDGAGCDPTVVNGGVINAYGANARLGQGEWMVVEADESDGSFVKLRPTIAIITNIDPEHMEHYKSFEQLKSAFKDFIRSIPFYGVAIVCLDHPVVAEIIKEIKDRYIITYGQSKEADIKAENIRVTSDGMVFDCVVNNESHYFKHAAQFKGISAVERLENILLPMHGYHNVTNALAAMAVSRVLHLPFVAVKEALKQFGGVKRRFTKVGIIKGAEVIDDYAHHPVEISAVISTARLRCRGKIIALVQPHRYSRLKDFFPDFSTSLMAADHVLLAPVYAAGEQAIPNINTTHLVEYMQKAGHPSISEVGESPSEIVKALDPLVEEGDIILCMGAGSITYWAQELSQAWQKHREEKGEGHQAA